MATPTALRIFSPESGLRPKPVEGSAGTIPAGLYGKTAHPYSRGTCWALPEASNVLDRFAYNSRQKRDRRTNDSEHDPCHEEPGNENPQSVLYIDFPCVSINKLPLRIMIKGRKRYKGGHHQAQTKRNIKDLHIAFHPCPPTRCRWQRPLLYPIIAFTAATTPIAPRITINMFTLKKARRAAKAPPASPCHGTSAPNQ